MPIRQLTADQVERLIRLRKLPNNVVVPTRDAVLIAGVGSLSTWQRLKRKGETPKVFPLNGSTDGFLNSDCQKMRGRQRRVPDAPVNAEAAEQAVA